MLHEMKGLNMAKIVNYSEYLKNKLSIKSIFSWLNGRAVEQLNSSISVKLFNLSTIKLKNLFTIYDSQLTKKVFAFTLAETLIVMGVIGIVAALTLPNLNQSTGDKEKVVKVKKIYSNMEDAIGRMEAVYGPMLTYGDTEKLANRLIDFIKYNKFTKTIPISDAFANKCMNSCFYIELADGSGVAIQNNTNFSTFTAAFYYVVDVDGIYKGANKLGKDIFIFSWDNQSAFLPGGFTDNSYSSCFSTGNCAHWVIYNENMDYLKANSSGKCNNSNVTLSTVNTTCK